MIKKINNFMVIRFLFMFTDPNSKYMLTLIFQKKLLKTVLKKT